MVLKTPIVLTVRSLDAVYWTTESDGTAALSYNFPDHFDVERPHAVKLLYVHGFSKPVFVKSTFIELQGLNRNPYHLLGTSIPSSNVYVPVHVNYIVATGYFLFSHVDTTPIQVLDDVVLAIHLVPIDVLHVWKQ